MPNPSGPGQVGPARESSWTALLPDHLRVGPAAMVTRGLSLDSTGGKTLLLYLNPQSKSRVAWPSASFTPCIHFPSFHPLPIGNSDTQPSPRAVGQFN